MSCKDHLKNQVPIGFFSLLQREFLSLGSGRIHAKSVKSLIDSYRIYSHICIDIIMTCHIYRLSCAPDLFDRQFCGIIDFEASV